MSTSYVRYPSITSGLTTGNLTDAGTDGIVVTGGTGAVVGTGTSIAQHVADTTHNGYLSSADWNTFSGKQSATLTSAHLFVGSAGNVATDTAITGDVTITNGGVTAVGTNKVANTQLAQMAANSIKGNNTAGVANAADLTVAQTNTLLGTVTSLAAVGAVPNANGASVASNTLTLQPADGTNPGVLSNTTQSIVGAKTFTTQMIGHGTATNDSAAAGYIGEYISNQSAGINAPTSTQFGDVTSISLTAGDWDVSVNGEAFIGSGTGMVSTGLGIGTASGNSSTGQIAGINFHNVAPPTANYIAHVTIASFQVSLSGTTIYYLKMYAEYGGGTPQFRGRISARRVR